MQNTVINRSEPIKLNSPLTDEQYNALSAKIDIIKHWISDNASYVKNNGLDAETFLALWGEHTQQMVANGLFSKDRSIIERLRLVWWFSGWPINAYTDLDTFPIIDPTYLRYQKLKTITPKRFQYAAPALFGEAGWIEGDGLVNHDVAILQERIQYLYFSGVAHYLDTKENGTILELGTGYGGMTLALHKSFPTYKQVLCDTPQALALAYAYLIIAAPETDHFAITADGVFRVGYPAQQVTPEEAFAQPGAFIYIPNYLFPAYEPFLRPNMVFNAMSLHEMHPKAIQYYCETVATLLEREQGVFCEINTHPGIENKAIDAPLGEKFNYCLEVDFPSLACRPRIWSNYSQTIEQIKGVKTTMEETYPLNEIFEFDRVVEFPIVEDAVIRKMITEQLKVYLGPTAYVLPPITEPFYGNHLRYIVQLRKKSVEIKSRQSVSEPGTEVELAQRVNELQMNIVSKESTLNAIYASRSWRCTLMLRKITNLLRLLKTKLFGGPCPSSAG